MFCVLHWETNSLHLFHHGDWPEWSAYKHLDRMHALCRICGERSRKRQPGTKYSQSYITLCRHVAPDLLKFHEIDILFDTPDVYSRTLCCKCYARIKKLKFSENPSSTTIQNAQSDIEKTSFLWKEFDPSLKSEQRHGVFQVLPAM